MASRITRNISLTPALGKFVDQRVKSGQYNSASEVVREGLRLLEQREAAKKAIRAKIKAGLDQANRGELIDSEEVFRRLRNSIKSDRRRRKAG